MSMTLDDLVKIYNDKVFEILAVGDISLTILDAKRAGIRAVVEALRDELLRKEGPDTHNLSERIGLRVAVKMFNDILGDAGEKAAADAISQTEGDENGSSRTARHRADEAQRAGRIPQGLSQADGRGNGTAGDTEGSGVGALRHDAEASGKPEYVAGSNETGRSRHVGGKSNHGVTAVKAAGGPTREDGPDVVISSVQAPAADPSPAVCEWRMVGKTFANAGCEDEYLWSHEYKVCPSCGKPITFKEAK